MLREAFITGNIQKKMLLLRIKRYAEDESTHSEILSLCLPRESFPLISMNDIVR